MLAQVAAENAAAQVALLRQAQSGRIPSEMWPRVASAFIGNGQIQLKWPAGSRADGGFGAGAGVLAWHIATMGRPTVYVRHMAAELSSRSVEARVAFIDELLSATTAPAAIDALNGARALLPGGR